MLDKCAEVPRRLEDLHAKEFARFLAKYLEQSFKPGGRVWVRNCIGKPPLHGKPQRVWEGTCEVLRRISPGTYRVNIRGGEEIFTSRRLKPYVPYKDDYVVECFLEDCPVRGERQRRVKFSWFPEPEWHYAGSLMHNINDTWARYNRQKGIDVSLSYLR